MRRVIVGGLLAAATILGLLAASQLIDYGVLHLRVQALDSDYHSSVFGLASLLAQAVVAAVMLWRGSRVERHRRAWYTLAALIAGLIFLRTLMNFDAKTVAAPLACVFWLLLWLTWRDARAARRLVWAALVLMVTSLLLHQVGLDADVLNYSNQSWAYQITAVAKHGFELAGWILLATAVAAGVVGAPASRLRPARRKMLDAESVR